MKQRATSTLRSPLGAAGLAGMLSLLGLLAAAPAGADEAADFDVQENVQENVQKASAQDFTPLESLFERQSPAQAPADSNGLYRFLGKKFKVGLSYSRPEFGGELASLEDHRVFFNVVGML
ncbi:MAG TPA: hypothetical protein VKA17_00390 [Gammaproteobacteria bacterium]|nr:hypothetical protein [Gammaproteobacteria bacterium]